MWTAGLRFTWRHKTVRGADEWTDYDILRVTIVVASNARFLRRLAYSDYISDRLDRQLRHRGNFVQSGFSEVLRNLI